MKIVLEKFRLYIPMIVALRTKGLNIRHWRSINKNLGCQLEPRMLTLFKLVCFKFYEQDKLKILKNICEIAQKEYNIQITIESVEKDFKNLEYKLELFQHTKTYIILEIDELNSNLEEYLLKMTALKTNPYVKNFIDRVVYLERAIITVIEMLKEW